MNKIKEAYTVPYPDAEEVQENFTFSTTHPDGVFKFHFRYFNERWNGWCTLPSGEIRAFGIEPNVISWAGFLDYGVMIQTSLPVIDRNSLFLTTLVLISWE